MQTTIQRVTLPERRRILMCSDLHGHADGLRTVLRQANFSKEDVLVLVGDYIEKGPQSLETLRLVMRLCREYTVYPLLGNVDLWRMERILSDDPEMQQSLLRYSLKAQQWWKTSFLGELCAEIGVALTAELDPQTVYPRLREHFAAEFAFLMGLPTVLETQRMIFVHGGLPHEDLAALEGTDCFPLLKMDAFWTRGLAFQKYVVVGHWPATLYRTKRPCSDPILDRERHIICLDGGCGLKDEGQLNLLALPSWDADLQAVTLYRWDGLPRITALDAQPPSEDSGYIHWGDHQVALLETAGENARVLHHGREMTVPAGFLQQKDGRTFCSDVTDYHLPVAPGDTLRLVYQLPQGCYVKKGGVTGWYFGRWEPCGRSD